MSRKAIKTDKAPKAIGPYSQAIRCGNTLYLSGQLPANPASGEISGDIRVQTKQVLENMRAILDAAGVSLNEVVKTTVYLKDLNDFAVMNDVFKQYFDHDPPARACVQVVAIPKGALIEIESIADLSVEK